MTDEDNNDEKNTESTTLNVLSTITDNLETYQGRDTAINLIHYIALIIADICSYYSYYCGHMSERFVNMYTTLENCRVMMRLFDDWNAIREFYRFRKLNKPMNSYLRWLNMVNLFFWVAYNPVEHLAWLSELRIIDSNEQLWWFYTNFCWAGGLITSVFLNLRVVLLYNQQNKDKAKREDDPKYDSSLLITKRDVRNAVVIAFRDFADFVIAVHYLPEGFLWSSQLRYYQVGLLGTFSSLLRVPTYILGREI